VNLEEYTLRRERERAAAAAPGRGLCLQCLHPTLTCYCAEVRPFDPKIRFAILIHGREAQNRIATGRISHLTLERSLLLQGYNYSDDKRVNELIADPDNHCVVLYPGRLSANLTTNPQARSFPRGKDLVVFVVDGTWVTARKTMLRSRNLRELPRISFDPPRESRFRIRKQPRPNCYSTVEAVHHTIELLGPGRGFALETRTHDSLLHVFDHMVEQQIELSKKRAPRFLRKQT
jgi:DTW domain-containing protein YfiP